MPFLSAAVGLLGVGASMGGSIMGFMGQQKAEKAQENAEKLREMQMNLDIARQNRELARRATVAHANITAAGAASGNLFSSGVQGGYATVANQLNSGQLALSQNQAIGAGIFQDNRIAAEGYSMANTGSAISSFGSLLGSGANMFGRVGAYLSGQGPGGIGNGWG